MAVSLFPTGGVQPTTHFLRAETKCSKHYRYFRSAWKHQWTHAASQPKVTMGNITVQGKACSSSRNSIIISPWQQPYWHNPRATKHHHCYTSTGFSRIFCCTPACQSLNSWLKEQWAEPSSPHWPPSCSRVASKGQQPTLWV